VVDKFVKQLKEKDVLLAKKTETLDEIARKTGMNDVDKSRLGDDTRSVHEGTGIFSRRDTLRSRQG